MATEPEQFLEPDLAALGAEAGHEMSQGADETVSRALAVQIDRLMTRSGVVMVGETRDAIGNPAIIVGVRSHRDMSRLPREVDGIPLVVQVIGTVDAQTG